MNKRVLFAALALLAASAVQAQTLQAVRPMQIQPVQAAAVIDHDALARQKLETDNRKLREENERLRQENDGFKTLGGSQVHAYCPNPSTSRNTAGAESDCKSAGYNCEPVSGLCRTTCQTSDMCAGGFTCDTGAQRCVYTAG